MKFIVYIAVFVFIILETSIFGKFPYYAIALSFAGYLVYVKDINAIWYVMPISLIIGISSSRIEEIIIFFVIYMFLMEQLYKHILFDHINIFIITFVEITLYLSFVYLFRLREIMVECWIKEFIFVLLYNFIFYYFERFKKKL